MKWCKAGAIGREGGGRSNTEKGVGEIFLFVKGNKICIWNIRGVYRLQFKCYYLTKLKAKWYSE